MDEQKLQLKLRAVKGIARRAGYPEYKAEDIAQQVALRACDGRKIEKQSNFHSYIDALREGSERSYNRRGVFTMPVYESSFENYSHIIDALRCETDNASIEESERDFYDTVCAIQKIERARGRIIILKFIHGWTVDKIAKHEGVTSSRIRQKCFDALKQIKKKVVQARISQGKQTERKRKEHRALSQKVQNTGGIQREAETQLEVLCFEKGTLMGTFKIKKIPKALCSSF